MIPQVTTKPNICRKLSGNLKRCGCRCAQWPSTLPTAPLGQRDPFLQFAGVLMRILLLSHSSLWNEAIEFFGHKSMCFLDGTGGDKGGIRGPAVGFPAWRWSIPGGGHVCSGSFAAEKNRKQTTKKSWRLLSALLSSFNIWDRGCQGSVEDAVRVWPAGNGGSGCISGMSLGRGNPSYMHVRGNKDGKRERYTLAGVAYYTKNRPGNHTLPVKQRAKPKLRPSIHAPIIQMPLYFLRKVGFKTEAMKSRCGFSYG